MTSLDDLIASIAQSNAKLPPVEKWQPQRRGNSEILIAANGDWFHQGDKINRLELVKLFASILVFEQGQYWLKTPVEQLSIIVDDLPFVVTNWQWLEQESQQHLAVFTNVEQCILLAPERLSINSDGLLAVTTHRNLQARVSRNVYYQWIEQAQQRTVKQRIELYLTAAGQDLILGSLPLDDA